MDRKDQYVCLSVGFDRDPKVASVTPVARYLVVRLSMYCAEELTDGHIPKVLMPRLMRDCGARRPHLAEVVSVGLLEETPTGYHLPAYLKWNPSRAELEEKRRLGRERQARYREKHYTPDGRAYAGVLRSV